MFPKPPKREPKPPKRIARRKRPNRVRKTPLGTLMRRAFTLHGKIVRARYPTCEVPADCCQRGPTQCSHLITRRKKKTAWDLDNAVGQCLPCHVYYTRRQQAWGIRLCEEFGVDFMRDLEQRADDPNVVVNRLLVEAKLAVLEAEARKMGLL